MSNHLNPAVPRVLLSTALCVSLSFPYSLYAADEAVDPAVAELTAPHSTVDIGVGDVSRSSFKFGQYNGLEKKGPFALGDIDLRGGGSYDSDSTFRWRVQGSDLGLDSRGIHAEAGEQGRFKVTAGFKDFVDNLSDTYQTPYLGAGSTSLSLPAGWIKPVVPQVSPNSLNFRSLSPAAGEGSAINAAGAVSVPTAAQLQTLQEIVVNDAGAFHSVNLRTERKREDLGFTFNMSPHLQLTASARHETQDGLQAIGAVSSAVAENSVILPNVIQTTTDQFNLGLEYGRPKSFFRLSYYGSTFKNDVNGISWQDPNDPTKSATLSSAPGNQFHQFTVAAGYNLTSTTKLTGDFSYGRNTQNQAFLSYAAAPIGLPESSLHGLVLTEAANLKLVMHPLRAVDVIAHYKYDNRANHTPIDTFVFYDVNIQKSGTSPLNAALGVAPATLGSNINIFDVRPESTRKNQLDLDADYRFLGNQKLAGGLEWQQIDRDCHGTWYSCVNANKSVERMAHLDWDASLESVSFRAGYSYAQRRVSYNPNAWLALVPLAQAIPATPGATTSVYGYLTQTGLTGFGPVAGLPTSALTGNAAIFSPNNNIVPQSLYGSRDNVSEIPGMRRFDMADRNRNRVRASADWQATDRFSTQATLEVTDDNYNHSLYGLQRATSWAASLDGSYAISDRLVANLFYTHENQHQKTAGDAYGSNSTAAFVGLPADTLVSGGCASTVQAKNAQAKIDPCVNWTANMNDRADTLGFSLLKKKLIWRRFDLNTDVVFTQAHTNIGMTGGSYVNNPFALAGAPPLGPGVPAALYIPAAGLPPVTTRTLELRLTGHINLSASADMRVFYLYQRMKSSDFAYQGMQFGTGTEQLPTLEQAPNYSVHVVGLTFGYRF